MLNRRIAGRDARQARFSLRSDGAADDPGVRIAHVSDVAWPRVGGIEIHVDELARRQRSLGHDVDVVTALGGNGRFWQRARPSVIADTCAAVRGGSYDVVHVHASVFSPIALGVAAATSRSGMPTVVTGHSLVSRYEPLLNAFDVVGRWTRWPVAWSAVSELAAAPMRRLIGDHGSVSVLPNAIDLDRWRVTPVARDQDVVVVAAVMRLASRKRPLALLRALRRARATLGSEVELRAVVVGDGPQRAGLERYCARYQLHDWVRLTGPLPHRAIRALYRRADLFVNPAVLESFGIAALEARTAGLPVVAMRRSAVSAFVEDHRSGLLADDDRGLAEAIGTLAADTELRTRIAAHNHRVVPSFGWDDALQCVECAYVRALAVQDAVPTRRIARRVIAEATR
jgi:glycosyltransferase involved in cell wall biosynthesis